MPLDAYGRAIIPPYVVKATATPLPDNFYFSLQFDERELGLSEDYEEWAITNISAKIMMSALGAETVEIGDIKCKILKMARMNDAGLDLFDMCDGNSDSLMRMYESVLTEDYEFQKGDIEYTGKSDSLLILAAQQLSLDTYYKSSQ